jgi:hypothetical protein
MTTSSRSYPVEPNLPESIDRRTFIIRNAGDRRGRRDDWNRVDSRSSCRTSR